MRLHPSFLTVVGSLLIATTACSQVRLPKMLGDHAVLRRERLIHLWGLATPDAYIKLTFHQEAIANIADEFGRCSGYLSPECAGGPEEFKINGDGPETIVTGVMVGDVWFASG